MAQSAISVKTETVASLKDHVINLLIGFDDVMRLNNDGVVGNSLFELYDAAVVDCHVTPASEEAAFSRIFYVLDVTSRCQIINQQPTHKH